MLSQIWQSEDTYFLKKSNLYIKVSTCYKFTGISLILLSEESKIK